MTSTTIELAHSFSLTTTSSLPTRTYTVIEVPVDDQDQSATKISSCGERIKNGESIVLIEDLVSTEECTFLIREVLRQDATPTALEKPGLVRIPTRSAAERAATFDVFL